MSHYTVMVITSPEQSVDELLAPFDENIEAEPYIDMTRQEIIDKVHNDDKQILERIEEALADDTDCWIGFAGDPWNERGRRFPTPEDLTKAKNLVANRSDEEAYNAYLADNADDYTFDEDGNQLSTYNPDSKWDWYMEGGRWDGIITTKDGEHVNQCLIGEIATGVDEDSEEYKRAVRFWEVAVEGGELQEGETKDDYFTLYRPEYYKEYYTDAADYASRVCEFGTYAVLTSDGVWHEPGQMGWFACSDETPESRDDWDRNYIKRFVEEQPDDYTATIVDCHI